MHKFNEGQLKNIAILNEFKNYPENWDGYGAARIKMSCIENAYKAIRVLNNVTFEVLPTCNGYVQFELDSVQDTWVILRFIDNNQMTLILADSQSNVSTETIDFGLTAITVWISKITPSYIQP